MRLISLPLVLSLTLGIATAQPSYPRIPGYDVGFPTEAAYFTAWHRGQPALIMAIPGDRSIATVFSEQVIPPGARHVRVTIHEFWVFEPRPCALGTPVYFQETYPSGVQAWGAIHEIGVNAFRHPFDLFFSPSDPGYSNWSLSYCDAAGCGGRCGTGAQNPLIEAYLITLEAN